MKNEKDEAKQEKEDIKISIDSGKAVTIYIESKTPILFSAPVREMANGEDPKEYEEVVWRNRCHCDENGMLIIPAIFFKNDLEESGKYSSIKLPGRGNQTYTKILTAGVQIPDCTPLNIHKDQVERYREFCDSKGRRRGSSGKVWKSFPMVRKYSGSFTILILDPRLTMEILEYYLTIMGEFVGIGKQRPKNGGTFGKFRVVKTECKPLKEYLKNK